MKVTTSTVAPREVELTIEPDAAFVEQAMRRAADRISRVRPVAGYRPGKAPYALVERIHGRDLILDEAIEHEAQAILDEAVREAQVQPLRAGQLTLSSHEPVVLKARVPLVPDVTLGDYRSIRVTAAPQASVSEEEIDREVGALRRRHAQREAAGRPVQMGDEVTAQILGRAEGQTVVDSHEAVLAVTDDLSPSGFAEALLGMSVGEERQFSLSYAADYTDASLAGKQVEFTVTLARVQQVNLPPLDDALGKLEGDHASLDALRTSLAERVVQAKERSDRNRESDQAVEALVGLSKFDYPDVMLSSETESLMDRRRTVVQQAGYTFENYLRMVGRTESEVRDEAQADAARRIARRILLAELARAEKLDLTEAETNQAMGMWYASISATYGRRAREVALHLSRSGAAASVLAEALGDKAAAYLADLATGRAAPMASDVQPDGAEPVADASPAAGPAA